MIKRLLTFVLGLQESVLVDFISQNKHKIFHKVKTCQNCLHQKFPYKNEQIYIYLGTCGLSVTTFFHQVLNYYYLTVHIMFKPKMSLEGSVH